MADRTTDPLAHLGYFTEWGGRAWRQLLRQAVVDYLGGDLTGLEVLEIGTRYGKMATLFALLGAKVTGIDLKEEPLERARAEARAAGVEGRVRFLSYEGSLDIFDDESFDVVFTKSVLVMVPELEQFMVDIHAKLRADGRVVFLENGRGGLLIRLLRRYRQRRWNYQRARYFTSREIALARRIFEVDQIRRTRLRPVWLILGRKQRASAR